MWAKKSLGQNFLISPRITENIALSANLQKNELVLEIGPGKGALTKELLRKYWR
jgi:16S rRNA (adenine1518-N6/adenine1519-N6)-dimethyltransferase